MRLPLLIVIIIITNKPLIAQLPDCQINQSHTHIELVGNKLVKKTSINIQINTAKGTKYAEVTIPYSKDNQIKILNAGIYDILGNKVRSLKKKDIQRAHTSSYLYFHSDNMILSFELIHNRYPYVVKYSYTEELKDYCFLAYWRSRPYRRVPVKEATLTVDIPEGFAYSIYDQHVEPVQINVQSGRKQLKWQVTDPDYIEREKYGPQSSELQSQVILIPDEFHYGVDGSSQSWSDFGLWLSNLKSECKALTDVEK